MGHPSSSWNGLPETWATRLGLGRPALRRALPWIGATLVLGTLFVIGQVIAWKQLTAQGFAFDQWSTPASYFFYIVTGLHVGHLVLGVLGLVLCLTALGGFKRVESRQIAVDITSWYWHTLGAAWILLFAVLVVGQ
jgi:cytochrome c oxidase subunit 3